MWKISTYLEDSKVLEYTTSLLTFNLNKPLFILFYCDFIHSL